MLFTQLFESDFNDKKRLAETQDDYEDCSYCSGTGEGRYEGQSCSHCHGTGVEPAEQDDDDFDIPDEPDDFGDEESYYEKSLRSRGLGEGVNNVGASIKALYQKIYRAGDDEIEYFYNDSPVFAQYWDEYEGDLDSIIAEVDPAELQVMLDELESYVQQANLAEGDVAKLAGITALGIGAGLGANYLDQQAPRVEFDGKNGQVVRAYLEPAWTNRIPDNAMTIKGKDGKTYHVWSSAGKGMNSKSYHAAPVEPVKEGFTKTPSGDYINQHTGVRSSKPPVKKKRGEKTGAEWDAIEKAKKDKEQGVAEGTGDGYYYLQGGIERSKKFASEAEAMAHSKRFFQLARVRRVTLKYKEPGQPPVVVKEFTFDDPEPPKSQMSWGDFYLQDKKQGMSEARAATARFRTGNKKRAELNAMSDEERRAYDKEQQEKQRRRDDARLEREREKLAAKKKDKVSESHMSELDAEYQDYKKLSPREFFNMYKITKQAWFEKHRGLLQGMSEGAVVSLDNHRPTPMTAEFANWLKANRPDITMRDLKDPATRNALYRQFQQQGLAEENKKKDELEPEVRDVALQRAITKAKADFPTAGSGLEALAKDFMRGQDQDQKSFDQIRRAERQQDQMLDKINQIDQTQNSEIQDLEQQNSGLTKRLQQLQSVNNELEKKLAAMSGRKGKRKTDKSQPAPTVAQTSISSPAAVAPAAQPEPDSKPEPTTSKAIGQVAKSLAPPVPSAAIDQMAQQLQPRQKELGFDEPVTLKPKKYDTSQAADVDYRELTSKLAKDIASDPNRARAFNPNVVKGVAGQQEMPLETKNKSSKSEPPEADYGPEYQDMVARVRKLAGQGPRKTVWDPVKRVYKTVPVNK